jgi:hypothetical protein
LYCCLFSSKECVTFSYYLSILAILPSLNILPIHYWLFR